jgi:hypothetical protein
MKSSIAIVSCLAAIASAAAPVAAKKVSTVNINIANDQTGQNGVATIPIDGLDHYIATAFAGTGIATAKYKASSAQLNAFPQTAFSCSIRGPAGKLLGVLTVTHTYADLDNNPNALTVLNLNGGTINCST